MKQVLTHLKIKYICCNMSANSEKIHKSSKERYKSTPQNEEIGLTQNGMEEGTAVGVLKI